MTIVLINDKTGAEIHLKETDDIKLLENQIILLGMNGLFYSELAQEIRDKIKKLKEK